jgi:hypothetical protein
MPPGCLDVAVRIERAATCAVGAEDLPDPYGGPARENGLEQRLVEAGLDVDMSQIARLLHEKVGPAVSVSEPQAQDKPAPIPPLETPPDEETPQESIWGDRRRRPVWRPAVSVSGPLRHDIAVVPTVAFPSSSPRAAAVPLPDELTLGPYPDPGEDRGAQVGSQRLTDRDLPAGGADPA